MSQLKIETCHQAFKMLDCLGEETVDNKLAILSKIKSLTSEQDYEKMLELKIAVQTVFIIAEVDHPSIHPKDRYSEDQIKGFCLDDLRKIPFWSDWTGSLSSALVTFNALTKGVDSQLAEHSVQPNMSPPSPPRFWREKWTTGRSDEHKKAAPFPQWH